MLALVAVLLVANLWFTWSVDRDIGTVIRQTAIQHTTMITKWHSKDGAMHKMTTHLGESNPSETNAEHAHRHSVWFAAMLEAFPL